MEDEVLKNKVLKQSGDSTAAMVGGMRKRKQRFLHINYKKNSSYGLSLIIKNSLGAIYALTKSTLPLFSCWWGLRQGLCPPPSMSHPSLYIKRGECQPVYLPSAWRLLSLSLLVLHLH
jgi:hypothetical protein